MIKTTEQILNGYGFSKKETDEDMYRALTAAICEYAEQFPASRYREALEKMRNALINLYPHCHEEGMKGESEYERAWLKCEEAIHNVTKILYQVDEQTDSEAGFYRPDHFKDDDNERV